MPTEALTVAQHPRKPLFPNPFYVVLLLVSTAFVVTALGYFVSPMVAQKALNPVDDGPSPHSLALAAWLDRNGPLVLAIEIGLMFLFALLAMATDHWFSPKPSRRRPDSI